MMKSKWVVWAGMSVLLGGAVGCSPEKQVGFQSEIMPIITRNCVECHTNNGQGTQKSGFEMTSYDTLMKGTKYGPVVIAGDPLSSSFYRLVAGLVDKSIKMPHSKEPLKDTEIKKIEQWILQGAKNN